MNKPFLFKMADRTRILFYSVTLICLCICSVHSQAPDLIVSTTVGSIFGMSKSVTFDGETKTVTRFLGIPFAEPPVNEKRFAKPQPLTVLPESPYNATFYRPLCPQSPQYASFDVAEDCLHLNIYIPGQAPLNTSAGFAVMIWIHDGAFMHGASRYFDSGILSTFNDVIVVTFNYRVALFGFLSCEAEECRGNYGLWDQHLAIKWVHQNIASFGGDPGKVTVFGNSAGAASGIYQAMYTGNKDYFHRVIAESGTPLGVWAVQRKASDVFQGLLQDAGCPNTTNTQAMQCLREKSMSDLIAIFPVLDLYLPVVDGDFVADVPDIFMANQTIQWNADVEMFQKLDLLMGVNDKDGALLIPSYVAILKAINLDIDNGFPAAFVENGVIPEFLEAYFPLGPSVLKPAILHEYTDFSDPDDNLKRMNKIYDLASDFYFFFPVLHTLNFHAIQTGTGRTYQYVFTHKPTFLQEPEWLEGADHARELPFIFGFPGSLSEEGNFSEVFVVAPSSSEVRLSRLIMTLWTNFAKYGNMATQNPLPYDWPEYTSEDMDYLEIATKTMTSSSTDQKFAEGRMDFWSNVIPSLLTCHTQCNQCGTCMSDPKDCPTQGAATVTVTILYLCFLVIANSLLM